MIKHAVEVLSQYPISEPVIEFIRHNENITFKVTDNKDSKNYLLRIHKPITEGLSGIQHTLKGLRSEIHLLQELNQKDILQVQTPVANYFGEFVTEYYSDEFNRSYATLLEWIEGSALSLDADNVEDIAFKLGEQLADLHKASYDYKLFGLDRPEYGAHSINHVLEELKYGVVEHVYSQSDYEIIAEVLEVVKGQITALNAREQQWGIIHADIQMNNVVVSEGKPCLIDYCLSGYGYYLFDLGSAATILNSEQRNTLLQGYGSKTTFSYDDIRNIEGFIFMDIFISYAMFIHDSNRNGWIKEHIVKTIPLCRDFLEGKEVFYSFK
ncbi:phosphotransferase enzyme family protein [Paenibacillus segetis]|uniref:Aminoglycoside phosphotransferase n=1 Tax=Paenibacillus segetis TaxID=1325360 RepID=A0ABQ1YEL5_9BACL|nr:phosphotransferase [Paenibacillus segetis]GGH23269.1 aminoglycoside phosphotransferase [Paenibacillus segetis]